MDALEVGVGVCLHGPVNLPLVFLLSQLPPLARLHLPPTAACQVELCPNNHRQTALHRVLQERDKDFVQLLQALAAGEIEREDGDRGPAAVEGGERGILLLACRVLDGKEEQRALRCNHTVASKVPTPQAAGLPREPHSSRPTSSELKRLRCSVERETFSKCAVVYSNARKKLPAK